MSIPIQVDEGKCLRLMELCTCIFNDHIQWAIENHTYSKAKAHAALYDTLTRNYPDVPTGLIQSVRDTALESVKSSKFKTKPKGGKHAALRFDKRTATLRGTKLTFSCLGPRQKVILQVPDYFKPLLAWDFKGMTLCYQQNQFWAKMVFECADPKIVDPKVVIGIDRGIRNMAVLSSGKIFSSKKANAGQRRYLHNRKTAQAKGTPSSRRRLKRLSGKEKRFSQDVNHCVTKQIARGEGDVFVLEKLQHIRKMRRGRKMNKRIASWPFYQFDFFLNYKAQALGKAVAYVDARFTSQRCSRCHHTARSNRNRAVFHCKKCGFHMHADLNASVNIRDRYLLSCLQDQSNLVMAGEQGAVNHPGVITPRCDDCSEESVASHGPCARGS